MSNEIGFNVNNCNIYGTAETLASVKLETTYLKLCSEYLLERFR